MEAVLQEWRERILQASADGIGLRLRGGGSKDWYGQQLRGEILDTRAYVGVLDYAPEELVITARCGTPLIDLEQMLAERGQMLAFEPPHFSAQATVGGMFCAGLSGPRRLQAGALRDYVLGASVMDGRGEILHFGGQVMKNVAGYDVSRLLAGSLGSLGLVLQVSLKVMPLPFVEYSLRLEMAAADAQQNLQRWLLQGLPLSASCWHQGQLSVRLSGSEAAVLAARKTLGGASLAHATTFWRNLREQEMAFFQQGQGQLWRLALPANAPILADQQLLEWDGRQRWLWLQDTARAGELRQFATRCGGHASLMRASPQEKLQIPVFTQPSAGVARIQRGIKQHFDPAGIFNPCRWYEDF